MRTFPKLRQPPVSRKTTTVFGGYNHNPVINDNEFFDMKNMSSDMYPVASVRKRRAMQLTSLSDHTPAQDAVAVLGRDDFGFSILENGDIYCGGSTAEHKLSGLIITDDIYHTETETSNPHHMQASVAAAVFAIAVSGVLGEYEFTYDRSEDAWYHSGSIVSLQDYGISVSGNVEENDTVTVTLTVRSTVPENMLPKQAVSMGAWVLIWPDKVYVNAVKLGNGDEMLEGEDYGQLENEVTIVSPKDVGEPVFYINPCDEYGNVVAAKAYREEDVEDPTEGDYVCNMEQKQWFVYRETDTGSFWELAKIYTVLQADGIAEGFSTEDYISIEAHSYMKFETSGSDNLSDGTLRRVVKTVGTDKLIIDAFWTGQYEQAEDWEEETPICTIRRTVPQLDYVVECGNRLWGCFYGQVDGEHINEIYACKLGDFKNWNTFAGISTDSYVASRGADGKYTGAAVYGGNPLFFRENSFEKVYPSAGGAHQITTVNYPGIQEGSWRSSVIVDGTLFYKGRDGVYAYTGSVPRLISDAFGGILYFNAVAASIGRKYYISMRDGVGEWSLFVLDAAKGLWHREDDTGFAWAAEFKDELYFLDRNRPDANTQKICCVPDSNDVPWMIESGIIGINAPDQKRIARVVLRLRLELGANAKISVQYDSDGRWHEKMHLHGNGLRTMVVPIVPIRCDHMKIRMSGTGGMELYSVAYNLEEGSDVP